MKRHFLEDQSVSYARGNYSFFTQRQKSKFYEALNLKGFAYYISETRVDEAKKDIQSNILHVYDVRYTFNN